MSTQLRAEKTHARILKAAEASFARHGYDGTGVAEICRRARLSKGAFYHHFPTKQAVFSELLNGWLAQLQGQLTASRAEAEGVPAELRAMAGLASGVFEAGHGQLPIFLEFWARAAREPAVWKSIVEPFREYRGVFARMIEAGIAVGSLRKVSPDAAAQVIVALAVGLLVQGLLDPDSADWGKTANEGIDMLLKGLEGS
jgi:AcrR family transcriptional regulator